MRKNKMSPPAASFETLKRPLLVYLQATLPSLNPAERLIAEYILKDPERILFSSISQMRHGSGASVGSIVGFCRSLGVKGFADFKITLARELAQGGFSASQKAMNGREDLSLFRNVFEFHSQSLKETEQLNRAENLERASRVLESAGRIEFFSIGLRKTEVDRTSSRDGMRFAPAARQCHATWQRGCRLWYFLFGQHERNRSLLGNRPRKEGHDSLPDELHEVAHHRSSGPGALRRAQRNQILPGSVGLSNHAACAGGCVIRFDRAPPQEPHPRPAPKRRRKVVGAPDLKGQ